MAPISTAGRHQRTVVLGLASTTALVIAILLSSAWLDISRMIPQGKKCGYGRIRRQ
jgi:hypothetical protein